MTGERAASRGGLNEVVASEERGGLISGVSQIKVVALGGLISGVTVSRLCQLGVAIKQAGVS